MKELSVYVGAIITSQCFVYQYEIFFITIAFSDFTVVCVCVGVCVCFKSLLYCQIHVHVHVLHFNVRLFWRAGGKSMLKIWRNLDLIKNLRWLQRLKTSCILSLNFYSMLITTCNTYKRTEIFKHQIGKWHSLTSLLMNGWNNHHRLESKILESKIFISFKLCFPSLVKFSYYM